MAASNFSSRHNSSVIFACGMNHYNTQEDLDFAEEDGFELELGAFNVDATQWDFECDTMNIKSALKAEGYEDGEKDTLCDKRLWDCYAGTDFGLVCKVTMQSGYYEGVQMDWEIIVRDNHYGYEFDLSELDEDDVRDMIYDATDNYGLAKIQAKNMLKYIKKVAQKEIDTMEKALSDYCLKLAVSAYFSNGETWYSKIA